MLTVAIIGRPNVGKSTLFNRLVGKRLAIVDDTPGVTRDRREGEARLGPLRFMVIDTAGLEDVRVGELEAAMQAQTERALAQADVALLLTDARSGVTPLDSHFADLLRRGSTPVILVANKCEGRAGNAGFMDAFALGLGEPVAISAEHGEGMGELYDALLPWAEEAGARDAEGMTEAGNETGGEAGAIARRPCIWRWSAAPTSANPHSSINCSAKSAWSPVPRRAPRATPLPWRGRTAVRKFG